MNKLLHILLLSYLSSNVFANTNTFKQEHQDAKTKKIQTLVQEKSFNENQLFEIDVKKEIKKQLKLRNPYKLSKKLTNKYYKNNNYQALFVSKDGIKPIAYSLLESIKDDQVLKPNLEDFFNFSTIELQLLKANKKDIKELIKADFMLLSIYHQYMSYLSKGIINWKEFQKKLKSLDEEKEIIANWRKYSVRKSFSKLLHKAIEENNINLAINEVNYTYPKAKELSELIKRYEEVAKKGGYTKVPTVTKSMKKGNLYPQIKFLRQRLIQSNDLKENNCVSKEDIHTNNLFKAEPQVELVKINEQLSVVKFVEPSIKPNTEAKLEIEKTKIIENCEELFDENVFQAVKSFQKNHGLKVDGIVGKNTVKRLNIPIEKKIKKMRVNLERMRWMPRELGERYLLVNIPDYNLKLYKEGQKELEMPVIVGEKRHPTPIFSHKVSKVVVNPYWRIPQRIVRREIIPKLVEDPEYLHKNEIKTFANWSHKSMQYDTSGVDWSMYLDNNLIGNTKFAPMRFIQIPGEKNPLGRMKFLFPNKYSVYLHDTPFKHFFKYNKRALSHGCIRLSEPNELLKTLANEDNKLNYEEAQEILTDIEKKDFYLSKNVPVHIIYLTTWIDDEGNVQFRDDIYNYDKMHEELLYNRSLLSKRKTF